MTRETKDYLHLHFIVLIWGFAAILGMSINMPTVELVFYRTFIATLGLYLVIKARGTSFSINDRRDFWIILGTGALIAVHWITFFLSARVSNISISLAGFATCSLWTAIIEPLSVGRKVKGYEVILGVLAIVGIVVIFNTEFNYFYGLLVAIISAIFCSVFSVINASLSKKYDPYVITFYEMIGAWVSIGLFFPIYSNTIVEKLQLSGSLLDFGFLSILAIFCTVYAYSISVELMKRLSVFSINLTVNLEPIYGIVLALIIFGESEKMTFGFYLGTGLILASVLLYPMLNRRFKQRALSTDIIR